MLGGASFKVRQLSNSSAKSDSCLTLQLAPPSGYIVVKNEQLHVYGEQRLYASIY
jgi:hypothetical protein